MSSILIEQRTGLGLMADETAITYTSSAFLFPRIHVRIARSISKDQMLQVLEKLPASRQPLFGLNESTVLVGRVKGDRVRLRPIFEPSRKNLFVWYKENTPEIRGDIRRTSDGCELDVIVERPWLLSALFLLGLIGSTLFLLYYAANSSYERLFMPGVATLFFLWAMYSSFRETLDSADYFVRKVQSLLDE